MKNFLFILILFSSGLLIHAHELPAKTILPFEAVTNGGFNELAITIEDGEMMQQVTLNFDSRQELQEFTEFDFADTIFPTEVTNSFCSVSITVTARVGVGSNFAQVSGTVSGIPCSKVGSTVRRMKQDLLNAIK
jgi:hypothetical protein